MEKKDYMMVLESRNASWKVGLLDARASSNWCGKVGLLDVTCVKYGCMKVGSPGHIVCQVCQIERRPIYLILSRI